MTNAPGRGLAESNFGPRLPARKLLERKKSQIEKRIKRRWFHEQRCKTSPNIWGK